MSRDRRSAVLIALALAIAAPACSAPKRNDAAFRPLDVGAPVPLYTARTLTGDAVRIGGANAGAPTVLNVWATWCASCREEMAALDSLSREFSRRGARVVAVSVDEGDVDKVRRFAESNHLTFAVAHDPAGDVQRAYRLVGVPTTFIVAKDGTLLWSHTGNIDAIMPEVRAAVTKAVER